MRILSRDYLFEQAPFAQCHASTVVGLPGGALLAAWFGGNREGAPDVAIWTARREASATAWDAPRQVASEPGAPCWNPVLFADGDRIWLFYKVAPTVPAWTGCSQLSRDGGITWEAPVRFPAGLLGPIKNKPIRMSNGEILCPTSVEAYGVWTCWVELLGVEGVPQQRFGPIAVPGEPFGIIQPTLWESEPGRIHLLARATKRIGAVCSAVSTDYGRTWPAASPTSLPNPNSGIDAVRLQDGRIVLAYNPVHAGRSPLSLSESGDNGRTWSAPLHLETEPGEYSYPAIIQTEDGLVHVTYTHQRTRIHHVVLEPGRKE